MPSQDYIDQFADYLDDWFKVTTNYSGRGMHDAECVGVTINSKNTLGDFVYAIFTIGCALGEEDDRAPRSVFRNFLQSMQIDSMGGDSIAYFPAARTKEPSYQR